MKSLIYERANGLCEAMVPPVCTFRGTDFHHRKLRSQGGVGEVNAGLLLCRACHHWVHHHPRQAEARGLIVRSMHDPGTTKVRYRNGGYVLLADVDPEHY